jgi:hypothetical protein
MTALSDINAEQQCQRSVPEWTLELASSIVLVSDVGMDAFVLFIQHLLRR